MNTLTLHKQRGAEPPRMMYILHCCLQHWHIVSELLLFLKSRAPLKPTRGFPNWSFGNLCDLTFRVTGPWALDQQSEVGDIAGGKKLTGHDNVVHNSAPNELHTAHRCPQYTTIGGFCSSIALTSRTCEHLRKRGIAGFQTAYSYEPWVNQYCSYGASAGTAGSLLTGC